MGGMVNHFNKLIKEHSANCFLSQSFIYFCPSVINGEHCRQAWYIMLPLLHADK